MKKIMFVVMLGCSSKQGADCDKAIDHSMQLSNTPKQLRDVAVARCKADNWSEDVLTCMTNAKLEVDAQTCYGKLTPDQQQRMNSSVK